MTCDHPNASTIYILFKKMSIEENDGAHLPDFGGPGKTFREVNPLCWGFQWWGRGRRLDDDVPVQRVHFPLNAAVRVLWVVLLVASVVVLEGIPLVVRVQAVLLDQRLRGAE